MGLRSYGAEEGAEGHCRDLGMQRFRVRFFFPISMLWICGAAMGFAPEWDSAALGLYAGAPGGAGVGLRHLRVLVMGAQVPKGPSDGDLGISRSW